MERYSEALERRYELWRYWQAPEAARRLPRFRTALARVGRGDDAPSLAVEILDTLDRGETLYVTPDICRLLDQAADALPEGVHLVPEQLLAHRGMIWLARPSPVAVLPGSGWDGIARDGQIGLTAITWHVRAGTIIDAPDGELFTTCYAPHMGGRLELLSGAAWSLNEPWNLGLKPPETPAEAVQIAHGLHVRRWLLALFAFTDQRILTRTVQRADRAARRRLLLSDRPEHEPRVQVVELRAREHPRREREAEHEPVAWSVQWIVRGHWRRQYYPSQRLHIPRWVAPYLKGPEGLPVKPPSERVFLVRR